VFLLLLLLFLLFFFFFCFLLFYFTALPCFVLFSVLPLNLTFLHSFHPTSPTLLHSYLSHYISLLLSRSPIRKYGTTNEQFAKVAEKNHRQSVHNSYALDRRPYTVSEILSSPSIVPPLTRLNSCSTADGASAVILASEDFLKQHSNLFSRAVEILDQQLVTDQTSTFDSNQLEFSFSTIAGVEIARIAAQRIFQNNHKKEEEEEGQEEGTSSSSFLTIKDVDVLEVHDCFSCNELFLYEALGLCSVGSGGLLIDSVQWRSNSQGGSLGFLGERGWVVNPSGGLESKGHPIGATGLYQTYELVQQLRGEAEKKQVPNARVALQHNFGIGSAVVVTLYRKPKKLSPGQRSKL
jgi:acetyl-CoA acetyltransferase